MPNDTNDDDDAIDTHELGRMIGMSPVTIRADRSRGGGPPFFRCGRGNRTVRYRKGTVRQWIAERTVGAK